MVSSRRIGGNDRLNIFEVFSKGIVQDLRHIGLHGVLGAGTQQNAGFFHRRLMTSVNAFFQFSKFISWQDGRFFCHQIKRTVAVRTVQDDSLSTYAAKITKEDCILDFSKDARTLHNLIRGLSPIPLALTHTPDGKLLKVIETRIADETKLHSSDEIGRVISLEGGIEVACARGSVRILRLLPEGKSRMSAEDFIRGRKIALGDRLS